MKNKLLSTILCLALAGCTTQSLGSSFDDGEFFIEGDFSRHEDVYLISGSGEYTLSGTLAGQVQVDAREESVTLYLDGVQITSDTRAPILIKNADDVTIEVVSGSENSIIDLRDERESENEDGAIYAVCDLRIQGKGKLSVNAASCNGIKTKDDLLVRDLALEVEAKGNALKGNDFVGIRNALATLTSHGSNGIHASKSDVSRSGEQMGIVEITDSSVAIHAAKDGIDAAYDVLISENSAVDITSGETSEESLTKELYLVVPGSMYKDNATYYAYFYNGEEDGKWVLCTYETMVYDTSRRTYYGLSCAVSREYDNVAFYEYAKGDKPGQDAATASTNGIAINSAMNAYLIGFGFSGDWVRLDNGTGEKNAYSCMGIKAGNEVVISSSKISIVSKDDGIHARMDKLESGATGLGNVFLTGSYIQIKAMDDAIHADHILEIRDGTVDIVESHEGMEANIVNIAGGECHVHADDDGINAMAGIQWPQVNISGGYLEITTMQGDTDGIDSNGDVTISGGTIIVKAGSSRGLVAGSIDVEGNLTVSGGTIIALGGICEMPSNQDVCTYINDSLRLAKGSYSFKDAKGSEILSFELDEEYKSIWLSSDQIKKGNSYVIEKDGIAVDQWKQSAIKVGSVDGQAQRSGR